jgi:hypothetical protein
MFHSLSVVESIKALISKSGILLKRGEFGFTALRIYGLSFKLISQIRQFSRLFCAKKPHAFW